MRDETGRGRPLTAAFACAVAAMAAASPALSQTPPEPRPETRSLYGMTGLIDMPSARMQPDGQLGFTASYFGGFLRNTLTFQVLPRLEGAFRYSALGDFFSDGGTLYDRSFDLKLQVSDETRLFPAVAVGLRDFLGTGVYSGEYIVASKALRPDLTVTGGLGWGRFSDLNGVSNPVGQVRASWRSRPGIGDASTGEVQFDHFLRGEDIGFFGGVEWRPAAAPGLVLKAEYSGDDYSREGRFSDYEPEIPFNFGAEYPVSDFLTLGAYAMYGRDFGLRASIAFNPDRAPLPQDTGPAPAPLRARPPAAQGAPDGLGEVVERIRPGPAPGSDARVEEVALDAATEGARWAVARLAETPAEGCPVDAALDLDAELGVIDGVTFRDPDGAALCSVVLRPDGRRWVETRRLRAGGHPVDWHADPARRAALESQLRADLAAERVRLVGFALDPRAARVEIANPTYNAAPQAVGRTARAMANALPPSVEDFEITLVESDLPAVTLKMRRARLEAQVSRPDAARRSWLATEVLDADPGPRAPLPRMDAEDPAFSWFLVPALPVSLFDPDQPLRADLRLRAGVRVDLARGLSVSGSIRKTVIGDLDDIERESDSELPHVRSDTALYAREGDPGLERLSADYLFKLAPAAYGRLSAGLLEGMFGGVSGELLWKSSTRDWGLGVELNYARQRDYDMRFGFQDYDVVTGHASLYWDTGWHGMEAQLDAGRYLAGDWGATFALTRRFSNGWEVGGFFTLTDVPFEEYGEGSFDKGLRLTIPFRWGLPFETRERFTTEIRPLTRDGGQRLSVANRLYPIVREMDAGDLRDDWGNFWR